MANVLVPIPLKLMLKKALVTRARLRTVQPQAGPTQVFRRVVFTNGKVARSLPVFSLKVWQVLSLRKSMSNLKDMGAQMLVS
jgi:hypothetical protein